MELSSGKLGVFRELRLRERAGNHGCLVTAGASEEDEISQKECTEKRAGQGSGSRRDQEKYSDQEKQHINLRDKSFKWGVEGQ